MDPGDNRSEIGTVPSSESLTTSTESESFETWTLVTEGGKKRPIIKTPQETEKNLDEDDRVEIIEREENNKRDNDNVDDLSDGISIISDSESAGRVSPHPFIGQSSSEKCFPEVSGTEFDGYDKELQYDPLTPPTTPKELDISSKVKPDLDRHKEREEKTTLEQNSRPLFGMGFRGMFYLSMLIAVAAFFGRMKYPEQGSVTSQITPLNQRIEELELQNNLLRAEIDLLNKHVNYLSQQKDKTGYKSEVKGSYKQDVNQFEEKNRESKIWHGDGDVGGIIDNENKIYQSGPVDEGKASGRNVHDDVKKDTKEYYEQREVKEGKKYEKYPKYPERPYPPHDGKYAKHDTGKDKKDYHSKEKYHKEEYDKYRKQKNRKMDKDHSGEDYREYDYNKNRKNGKYDDDWHEKMMQQREDLRKKYEKHDSNNWYIERGNGREEARIFDKRDYEFRRDGR